jgi:hypothetical protein
MDEEHEENWDIPVPSAEDGISKKRGGGSMEDMDIGDDSDDNLSMDEMAEALEKLELRKKYYEAKKQVDLLRLRDRQTAMHLKVLSSREQSRASSVASFSARNEANI